MTEAQLREKYDFGPTHELLVTQFGRRVILMERKEDDEGDQWLHIVKLNTDYHGEWSWDIVDAICELNGVPKKTGNE